MRRCRRKVGVRLGTPPSSLDDVTLEWNKPKEEDEGPGFESWRMKLVFQLNTNISRSETIVLSSMQAVTTTMAGKQIGAPTTQAVMALARPHAMPRAGRRCGL